MEVILVIIGVTLALFLFYAVPALIGAIFIVSGEVVGKKFKNWREEVNERAREGRQEKLRLEEEVVYEKVVKQQEELKRKEEKYQKYLDLEKQIRIMPIYERWRQDVFKKCGKLCQICGSDKNLEVHHRVSFHSIMKHHSITSKEMAFECLPLWHVNNGEVLCKECHDKMESSKNRQSLTTKFKNREIISRWR